MTEQTKRTFIAIELPPAVRSALGLTQERLRAQMGSAASAVRWTRPDGIHLTLLFLGDTPLPLVEQVGEALQKACDGSHPFGLYTSSIGAFPNTQRARVLWVGLEGDAEGTSALHKLQGAVSSGLEPLGLKPDKSFSPHLTLGRVRDSVIPADRAAIAAAMQQVKVAPVSFAVREVSLMESRLDSGGAVYTQLRSVELR